MTDEDIEKLANKIAEAFIKKQEEYDAQFEIDMNKLAEESIVYTFSTSSTRDVLSELEAELKNCIDKEDYKQAAILADKIKKLKDEKS